MCNLDFLLFIVSFIGSLIITIILCDRMGKNGWRKKIEPVVFSWKTFDITVFPLVAKLVTVGVSMGGAFLDKFVEKSIVKIRVVNYPKPIICDYKDIRINREAVDSAIDGLPDGLYTVAVKTKSPHLDVESSWSDPILYVKN